MYQFFFIDFLNLLKIMNTPLSLQQYGECNICQEACILVPPFILKRFNVLVQTLMCFYFVRHRTSSAPIDAPVYFTGIASPACTRRHHRNAECARIASRSGNENHNIFFCNINMSSNSIFCPLMPFNLLRKRKFEALTRNEYERMRVLRKLYTKIVDA
jgi:hypothetical protein